MFNQKIFFVFSSIGVFASFVMQYGFGLIPCPLCIMQRVCITLIALTGGLAVYFPVFVQKKVYWCLQTLWLIGGLFFVSRQLWLQSLPAKAQLGCMPEFDVLIAYFPWTEVVKTLVLGGSECAVISFRFLGLSLTTWSLLYFTTIAVFFIASLRQKLHAG